MEVICINDNFGQLRCSVTGQPIVDETMTYPKLHDILTPIGVHMMPGGVMAYQFAEHNAGNVIHYYECDHFADISKIQNQIEQSLHAPAPIKRFKITKDEDYIDAMLWAQQYAGKITKIKFV